MHIRCPHCQNPIELVEAERSDEIACPSCGSNFRVDTEATAAWSPEAGGRKLGRFELIDAVGAGAFGTVYMAHDPDLDRTVAVKVPRAGNLATSEDLDRFLRESRSVAQLRHPGIVPIYEVGQTDGVPFLVSEFVRGTTLADRLTSQRLSPREATELVACVADTLQYAHNEGVVHRDVKPANIMLESAAVHSSTTGSGSPTSESASGVSRSGSSIATAPAVGMPRLMDFGLAKRAAGEITMTVEGQVLGTPAYMSPEQAAGEAHKVDGRSDLYSLGVILYELLTGELPFRGNQRMLIHQVLHDEPRQPRSLNDRIARDLETVCLKAMAKEPEGRYQGAGGLAEDLRRWLNGKPILARPVGKPERIWRWCRRNPLVASLSAAVAFLLVAGTSVATYFAVDATRARDRADAKAVEAIKNAERAERQADSAWHNQYVAHVHLMHSDWENVNIARVLATLEVYRQPPAGREDLRGWEWYYQNRLCRQELRTLEGHTDEVYSAVFSPDGARLASSSLDGRLILWDPATGQNLRIIMIPGGVSSVAFSPDGMWIASAGSHGVNVWDATTGQNLRTVWHSGATCVVFSPDGAQLASGGEGHAVKLWQSATGEEIQTLDGHTDEVRDLTFSPDGERLASASKDRTVKLWDVATGRELQTLKGHHVQPVDSVVFSPDGSRLASAGGEFDMVMLWDGRTGQKLRVLEGHTGGVHCVAFSPDGRWLASASWDWTVKLWDAATGEQLQTLIGHSQVVRDISFSPDGTRLVSAGSDGTVKVWNAARDEGFRTLQGHAITVNDIAFSPDGTRLASAGWDQTVRLWEMATGQQLRTLEGHTDVVDEVVFSPNGARLASASRDQTVKIWDAATGQELRTLGGHADWVGGLAFSPDGQRLASASRDQMVNIYDTQTGRKLRSLEHKEAVFDVAFSPDGTRLGSIIRDQLKLWDAETGREIRTLEERANYLRDVAFSPDGTRLASAGDWTVRLWDALMGRQIGILRGHTFPVAEVAFSPDGTRLASGSWDRTVKLWDTVTGQELRTLRAHTDMVRSVAFSPDGAWLASAGRDGTIKLWDGRPLTPEVSAEIEAVGLLETLYSRPLPTSEIAAALHNDRIISHAARQKALELIERFEQEADPSRYYAAAWPVIRHPYANVFMCRFSLAQMRAACSLAADDPQYQIGLGVAQYRLGKFENERHAECLATLTRCDQNHPAVVAFLAMTQHQLGKQDVAKTTLVRLRKTIKDPKWADKQDAAAFLREAVELIEGGTQPNR